MKLQNKYTPSDADAKSYEFLIKELQDAKGRLEYFQKMASGNNKTLLTGYVNRINFILTEIRTKSYKKDSHGALFARMAEEGTALFSVIELLISLNETSLDELFTVVQTMSNGYPVDFVQYEKGTSEEERKQCAELNALYG